MYTAKYKSGVSFSLAHNQLTQVSESVFKSIIESYIGNTYDSSTTFIDFSSSMEIQFIYWKILNQRGILLTIDPTLDCGTSLSKCGSEYWFLSEVNFRKYFIGTCQNGQTFSVYDKVACDTPHNMSPCKSVTKNKGEQTAIVDCSSLGLDDDTLAGLITII